jgi:hypothetical protein
MLVMRLCSVVAAIVLAVWLAFLVAVIAFASGVAAWIWLVYGAGR